MLKTNREVADAKSAVHRMSDNFFGWLVNRRQCLTELTNVGNKIGPETVSESTLKEF